MTYGHFCAWHSASKHVHFSGNMWIYIFYTNPVDTVYSMGVVGVVADHICKHALWHFDLSDTPEPQVLI